MFSSMTETRREAEGSPKETKKVHSDCSSSKTDNSSWIPAVAEIQDSDRGAEVVSPRPTTVQQHLLAVADAASSQLARVLPPPEQLPKPLARVYHSLWRGHTASASSSARGSVVEPLVTSGSSNSDLPRPLRRHVGGEGAPSISGSSLRINTSRRGSTAGFSRPTSHRALNELDHQAAQEKWDAIRPLLVAWLCASLITLLLSWWWFALGCLVGVIGAIGAVAALRHRTGVDLIQPAKGAQFLGVITGLISAAATLVVVATLTSVRCKYMVADDCTRLRFMLCFLISWFTAMTILSSSAAYRSYQIIQLLSPTFYWRQSEVAIPEEEEGGRVLLRQETFTPRAATLMPETIDAF